MSTPKKPAQLTANLHVRLPPDEKRDIERAASKDQPRFNVNTWVRLKLREAVEAVLKR